MPQNLFHLLLAVLSCICAACGGGPADEFPIRKDAFCNDGATLVNKSAVWLCGDATADNISDTISMLSTLESPKLVIDTFGGDSIAGIKLARYVHDQKIPVYVNKVCLSSCSQYLLLAAPEVHFRRYSVIVMHDTQASTNIIANYAEPQTAELAQIEREFYSELGINQQILTLPTVAMHAKCILNREEFKVTGALHLKADLDFFVPDERFFRRFYNGEIKTDYPKRTNVERLIEGSKFGELWRFNYSTPNNVELIPLLDCEKRKELAPERPS